MNRLALGNLALALATLVAYSSAWSASDAHLPRDFYGARLGMSESELKQVMAQKNLTSCEIHHAPADAAPEHQVIEQVVCRFADQSKDAMQMIEFDLYNNQLFAIESRFKPPHAAEAYTGLLGKFGNPQDEDEFDEKLPAMTDEAPEQEACRRMPCKVISWNTGKDPIQIMALIKNMDAPEKEVLFFRFLDETVNKTVAKALIKYQNDGPAQTAKKLGF